MKTKSLALYHYDSCPFCQIVRTAISEYGINVESRNIHVNPKHFLDLNQYGGKPQVPCLLIEKTDGNKEWLYESTEIVAFLKQHSSRPSLAERIG